MKSIAHSRLNLQIALSTVVITSFLLIGVTSTAVADEVTSLRGNTALTEISAAPQVRRLDKDSGPLDRAYMQQPPLIPHKIEGYIINLKSNKCLSCHSWANARQNNAPRISQTHFQDRQNRSQANVSALRYFCLQCHVPQTNARQLVENTFKPVIGIIGN